MSKTNPSSIGTNVARVAFNFKVILNRSAVVAFLFCAATLSTVGQTPVLTQHNDNARTGQNTSETILTTANVNVGQFGKLFSLPTDGQVYAQPLYVPGVTINGVVHNVVIIATEADSVYAYDADSNAGANSLPLWKASLVPAGETPLNSALTIGCTDLQPQIGITATPVIDSASNTIYVEAKTTNGSNYFHRLHALNLLTGAEKSPGPIQIAATVTGTGDGSTSGKLVFDSATMSLHQQARPGLLLVNSTIFIAFASHCDSGPYHGWLFSYDEATLTQKSVYVTTPNGGLGGFWMSGAGIAADTGGDIYIASGNGDFDTTNVPARETGDTLLKLGTTNQILTQLDYFTPLDQQSLDNNDTDLGSGGTLLLPDQSTSTPHILVHAGKEGRIYVVNRDQFTTSNSHYCSGCTNDTEIIEESSSGAVGGMWSMPAYWNNNLYYWGSGDVLKAIPISNGLPDFTHITSNSTGFGFPGATPSISSNGTTAGTAILWAIDSSQYGSPGPGPGPAVLYAYDATNISNQLWNSTQGTNNAAGDAVKFATPTVSNGKVYVGTSTEVDVYGLLNGGMPTAATPVISPASETVTTPIQVTIVDSTPGASIYYTTDGTAPSPTHGTHYTSAFTLTSSATVKAMAAATNFTNSSAATAIYAIQSTPFTINFGSGFAGETTLTLSGSAAINGARLRLTDTGGSEAGSGFFSTPVNVQSFTTDFSFQLTTPNGDGFTFAIHGGGAPAALGPSGGGLGYGPDTPGGTAGIPASVAVKFDLYSNAGEGTDSTGIYTNGASPTIPAVDMSSSGVNLHSGDVFQVHMSYDGTNLSMIVTDVSTGKVFSQTFANINIPATIGGNNGYVGFTGGTGGSTAIQEIVTWTYTGSTATAPQAATPKISPAAGSYSGSVAVTITDSTGGASITYTTDGSTPVPGSHGTTIASGGSFTLSGSATVEAIASASGFSNSSIANTAYTITTSPASTINFGSGFAGETTLALSGSAAINGSRLRLTDTGGNEAGSGFFSTPVNIQSFTTDFSFQLTTPNGDGFTFAIHGGSAAAALGPAGGGLGYGPDQPGGTPAGIPASVAVKFDLYSNAGEGPDSTGIYTNGASPTTPFVDMTNSGVNLHSGDVFQVHMAYDGTNLAMTVTDVTTGKVFTNTFANVNIPGVIGGNTGYVGFTGGTGGSTAIQEIVTWTYSSGSGTIPQAATPQVTPAAGSYTSSVKVTLADSTSGATITYTTDGSTPIPGSHGTAIASGGSFTLTSSATVTAIASASGFTASNLATAVYSITVPPPPAAATPQITPAAGTYSGSVTVSITDTTSGATITYTTDGSTPVPGSHGTAIASGGSFTLASSATVEAIASASGFTNSSAATTAYTVTAAPPMAINFGSGFAGETTLSLNGGATINGTRLRLTDGGTNEARTAFNTTPVNVTQFVTDFTFQLTNPSGDGMTFTIQGVAPTAVGPAGGGLGYGPDSPGLAPGIAKSVAIKFDLYNNNGEGVDSTGSYLDGASPTTPATDMTSSGVNLHSGDVFQVHVTYDGTTLAWKVTDTTTAKTFSSSAPVNIPATVGANTGYVGFTGGTGGSTATQEVLSWTYGTSASAALQFETESATVFNASTSSGPTYRIFAWTGFTNGSGTTLDATATGQFVTITLNVPQAGTYDVRFATKKYSTRGIVQLSINGANVGPAEDEFSATEVWQEFDLGNVALAAGNQQFKFTTASKNASSGGYTQAFDYIKLTPQ
jgi:Legume lectin domain/Chitobiase/beta-hexosaminidase C-terminal domain